MRASDIVAAVRAGGYAPPTRTRTPAQTVNRDLHGALRRGDTRIVGGPGRGQFRAATAHMGAKPSPAPNPRKRASAGPRLPILPLALLVAAKGGLAACGVRHQAGDCIDRVRWAARIERAYLRARRRGWITLQAADQISVSVLLLHPSEVWHDAWWDA